MPRPRPATRGARTSGFGLPREAQSSQVKREAPGAFVNAIGPRSLGSIQSPVSKEPIHLATPFYRVSPLSTKFSDTPVVDHFCNEMLLSYLPKSASFVCNLTTGTPGAPVLLLINSCDCET